VGSRWKRIAVPAIGLFAVMAALALVAGAPIVLFSDDSRLDAAPAPAAGSSEVTQVTTVPQDQPMPGASPPTSSPNGAQVPDASPAATSDGAVVIGSPTDGQPVAPRRPARERPSGEEGPADEGNYKDKAKHRNGKAKGHDKSKAQGNAKGHDKWHGSSSAGEGESQGSPVAFDPPRGQKPGHVGHSGGGKHAGRGHRPHARPRR
jgi:hypothetical protein